jgi:2-keto-4-pentenoate hydratase
LPFLAIVKTLHQVRHVHSPEIKVMAQYRLVVNSEYCKKLMSRLRIIPFMATFQIAAARLAEARRLGSPIDRLPEEQRPRDNEEALETQRRVLELIQEEIGGWKCSVPNGDRILVAPLPASTVRRTSPCLIVPKGGVAEIEPEIAFVLKRDLPPRATAYGEDEIRDAILETRLVLELIGSRYKDVDSISWLESLADSVRHQGIFIGPVASGRTLESFHLRIEGPLGVVFERGVKHPNGDPLKPLYWLANFLSSRGETLRGGTVITTGSYAGIIEVPMETPLSFEYGGLGRFSVQFSGKMGS